MEHKFLYDKFIDWRTRVVSTVNGEEIIPYEGKFAVKRADAFELIKQEQSILPTDWLYKPINVEIEITNQCNLKCQHCGMHANLPHEIVSQSLVTLDNFVKDMAKYKTMSIGFTGGEPFMVFDKVCHVINTCQENGVDIMKITSNGFWGKQADKYFDELEKAGFLKNKIFNPLLMISVGEQTVPLETIAHLLHSAINRYTTEDITLCISSLVNYGEQSKVPALLEVYAQLFGDFPKDEVYLTETHYKNNDEMKDKANVYYQKTTEMLDTSIPCHTPTVGKHILPRMLVKADGTVYPCACFNVPPMFKSLNAYTDGLEAVLKDLNSREYIRFICEKGLKGFYKYYDREELDKMQFDDICTLCGYLCKNYKSKSQCAK